MDRSICAGITVLSERELESVKIYDPTLGSSVAQDMSRVRAVTLTLSDHPVVLEMEQLR